MHPDVARYHRQMLLPGVGPEGQARLARAHAAIVGCGALGCAAADHLARAGVGCLTLVDRDVVEWTNLQRQTLFSEADARDALPKAHAARRRLAEVNSGARLRDVVADLTPANAARLLGLHPADPEVPTPQVLIDGTDNFETRYLLNDLAVRYGTPLVYGGVVAARGMESTFLPRPLPSPSGDIGPTACLRCMFEDPPPLGSAPTCDTAGVLGPAVAIVAAVQAADALKILLGRPDLLSPTILDIDLWSNSRRRLTLQRRPDCPCCGRGRFDFLDRAPDADTALCGQDAVQIAAPAAVPHTLLGDLADRLRPHGAVERLGAMLVRTRLEHERADDGARPIHLTVFADGRAIVKGTTRPARARAVYARYVGA